MSSKAEIKRNFRTAVSTLNREGRFINPQPDAKPSPKIYIWVPTEETREARLESIKKVLSFIPGITVTYTSNESMIAVWFD